MRLRLGKSRDIKPLLALYRSLEAELGKSFLLELGGRFVREYLRVYLNERYSLFLCLENDEGRIVGTVFGTMDAAEHAAELSRNKARLGLAALPVLLRRPGLVRGLREREKSSSAESGEGYVVRKGCRIEFWGCAREVRGGGAAIQLLKKWLALASAMGAEEAWFEVDDELDGVIRLHKALGARGVRETLTPAGRKRQIMRYILTKPAPAAGQP
jgi:hypothetical protein